MPSESSTDRAIMITSLSLYPFQDTPLHSYHGHFQGVCSHRTRDYLTTPRLTPTLLRQRPDDVGLEGRNLPVQRGTYNNVSLMCVFPRC